ncbi:MAG: SMC-Scp complex subunit ScpB [Leptolyngbya sp. PLA2]|nr:SMC-Scp complex subunit ScpB [Leptolyngbya sp. PL-A2]
MWASSSASRMVCGVIVVCPRTPHGRRDAARPAPAGSSGAASTPPRPFLSLPSPSPARRRAVRTIARFSDRAPDGWYHRGMPNALEHAAGNPTTDDAPLPDQPFTAPLEAVLVSADRPVPARRIAEILGLLPEGADPRQASRAENTIRAGVDALNAEYARSDRAFRVEALAGGYRLMTLPQHAGVVSRYHGARASSRLSRAALETLAVIAYRQPVTRAEVEAIRGVACGEVLRTLLERRLIAITGRAEELGRPMLYGTSKQFLDAFGLASIKDLPTVAELNFDGTGGEA